MWLYCRPKRSRVENDFAKGRCKSPPEPLTTPHSLTCTSTTFSLPKYRSTSISNLPRPDSVDRSCDAECTWHRSRQYLTRSGYADRARIEAREGREVPRRVPRGPHVWMFSSFRVGSFESWAVLWRVDAGGGGHAGMCTGRQDGDETYHTLHDDCNRGILCEQHIQVVCYILTSCVCIEVLGCTRASMSAWLIRRDGI